LVGGEDLEPFEEQTLALARENFAMSRRTYRIAILGFIAAAAAAVFVGTQVKIMSVQTQILASQSESAAGGAAIGELNTRKQLAIAQQQAQAAQDNVAVVRRGIEENSARSKEALDTAIKSSQLDQRAWVGVVGVNTDGGVATYEDFSVKGATLVIHNSGKTPALKIRIECCMFTNRLWTDPIPDYDAEVKATEESRAAGRKKSRERMEEQIRQHPEMRDMMIARDKEFWDRYDSSLRTMFHQGGVLAPTVATPIGIIPSMKWGTRNEQKLPITIYVLGKIVYRDVSSDTAEHTTKFCLMREVGTAFTICPENNWMD